MKLQSKTIVVLLVEDNPGDARLIRERLVVAHGDDFRVEHVARVVEACERLAEGGIDLVLLDLYLPDSSGIGTVTRVHAAAPRVPIVVLTGMNDEEFAERMRVGFSIVVAAIERGEGQWRHPAW